VQGPTGDAFCAVALDANSTRAAQTIRAVFIIDPHLLGGIMVQALLQYKKQNADWHLLIQINDVHFGSRIGKSRIEDN
jgi:hypothetical protein